LNLEVMYKCRLNSEQGFSLIELLIVMAAIAILLAIAVPSYQSVMAKKNLSKTIEDLNIIATALDQKFYSENQYPESLSEIGLDSMKDPWGNSYHYLNVTNSANANLARKDSSQRPVNSDFDLYSAGKDGETAINISDNKSEDDIVRANSGGYFGLAVDY